MEQLKRLQSIEREMLSEGKSSSEIDAFKAKLRQQSYTGTTPQMGGVAAYMQEGGDPAEKSFFERFNPLTGSYRRKKPLSVKGAETAIDFSPVGTVKAIDEIYDEYQQEDPDLTKMGIMAAAEVAGYVPLAGPGIKKMARGRLSIAEEMAAQKQRSINGQIADYKVDLEENTLLSKEEIESRVNRFIYNINKENGMADGGAVMQGVGSLNETARNMSRGPRGIAGYQQFADGGPVYMQEGGEPEVFNQEDQQNIFSQIEMMDRNKTYTTNETRNLRADLIEQFGDTELGADLMPFLKNDPIAMLGYKAERMLGKNKSKVLSYDFRNNNNTAASYTPDSDIVKYNSDTASSLDIIIHELRHRGINILRQNLINDGVDPDRPSTSATGPNEAQRNFVQQYGSNAYDILLKSPAAKEEFFVELMDDPDATYISPQGYAVPSEDTVPSEDMTQAEYIASLTQPLSDNMQFVNLEDVRTRRETGVYPEGPDVELPFYWAGGPGFSLDAKVGAISRENIDAGMAGVNKAATDLLQRNKMLQRANATNQ